MAELTYAELTKGWESTRLSHNVIENKVSF